ncbi:PREDICTED: uncharacterized protein LOC109159940 [Ipomoea nil]|uniref:uncharacterized protein LOC109159940 n=1 Tax=Ipomoea nil TaxID=35883 RepID=UPI0009010739|nr:PREDICTED: uncharacterized protein LOC109159940 [Ipomoea nil]
MSTLFWNCRGLGNPRTVQEVVDLVSKKKPEFVFLMETMVDRSHAERLRVKLGLEGCFAVDSDGQRGGLCFLWAKNNGARLIKYSTNHIDLEISLPDKPLWRLTCYYGFAQRDRRRAAWDFLRSLKGVSDLPWVVLGDFNDLLMQADKRGRLPHPVGLIEGFAEALDDCGLMTLPMIGYPYTWERGKETARWVEEHLDRLVANIDWLQGNDRARVFNIQTDSSDHTALFLDIGGVDHVLRPRGFRFENAWLLDGGCREVVEREWSNTPGLALQARLGVCGRGLRRWGGDRHHKYGKRVEGIKKEINGLRGSHDPVSLARFRQLDEQLTVVLAQEEAFWRQRAKQHWLQGADRNTMFFHKYATYRKKKNVIQRLKDDGGVWRERNALDSVPEEVRSALFSMGKDKSPGRDGMNPGFYQAFWDVIGKDVSDFVLNCLSEKSFPANLNDANIVLIPKKCSPVSVADLRPIALCNVLYKIMAKMIANRMKPLLEGMISVSQSAFLPGRLISDNILIASEVGHYLRRKQLGQSVWYRVLVNGKPTKEIVPTRGLRQGDPLSPYLFIICAEGLSLLLQDSQAKGLLHGCRVARGAPSISHLVFADDSLLFFKANLQEALEVKRCLGIYEAFSGQAVNFQKSSITFSRNTQVEVRYLVANSLGVGQADDFGKYLGLPSVVGRNRSVVFAYVEQKLRQRFGSWNKRLLFKAGKEVLLKSVAQAMPAYTMSIYLLPMTLCNALERLMNRYWWGQSSSQGSIHWMSWDRMCVPKKFGGMGFKRLHEFNIALLAKQGWRLLTNPESLVARVFKARYYPTSSFYEATIVGNPSYAWRSIFAGQTLLKSGCRRRIGNGRTTRVLNHPWLPDAIDPYVASTHPGLGQELLVSDLIDNATNGWNNELLDELFAPRDVLLIKQLPVSLECDDDWFWDRDLRGCYSVKDGYRRLGEVNGPCLPVWGNLWSLQVPPRWRIFMWRALSDILPTLDNLINRRVELINICPACGMEEETIMHVLCSYSFASQVWNFSQLLIPSFDGRSFRQWTDLWLGNSLTYSSEAQGRICGLLYDIWTARNEAVWDGCLLMPCVVVRRFTTKWISWTAADQHRSTTRVAHVPPGPASVLDDGVICRVNAGFHGPNHAPAYGFIVQEMDGTFVAAGNGPLICPYDPLLAEAMTLCEVLSWLRDNGYSRISVCSNSLVLVSSLKHASSFRTYFGYVLLACNRLLSSMTRSTVIHVRRDDLQAAHVMAKHVTASLAHSLWRDIPPSFLEPGMANAI